MAKTMKAKVQGQRSPRWAVWKRMLIPCSGPNGEAVPYLARLRIIQTPWFGVYLHDIYEADGQDPHNHPWTFYSFVLRGHYTESFFPVPWVTTNFSCANHWRRFSIHKMDSKSAHRIVQAAPGLKTLIITGPRKKDWGFFTKEGWVPWQRYEALNAQRRAQN